MSSRDNNYSDLTAVSVEALNTISQGMVDSVISAQSMEVEEMVEAAEAHYEMLLAALELDNQIVSQGPIMYVPDENNEGKTKKVRMVKRAHVELIGANNKGDIEGRYQKATDEYQNYIDLTTIYKGYCKALQGSAAEIQRHIEGIINSLTESEEEPKKDVEEPKKDDEEPKKEDEETTDDTGGGRLPGGGNYDGGGSSGGGYTPPAATSTSTKEKNKDKKTDYGDGDEGKEVEPTVTTPSTTIPTTTSTQVAPTSTQQTAKPTETSKTTESTKITEPEKTIIPTTEQHSGGGYSAASGYKYDNSVPETKEKGLQEEASSSIDNIISGKIQSKIPTSSAPISKIRTTSTKGSSVIPAASGIATAAVIGLGAKAYLDKKRTQEEEETEEMFE